ncbi:glycosyltransferase family 2 protein [Aeromonas sp. 96A]|uniref:glycosyltransferase family 2 protein n=1 Tax=Aeromonas sp. 96A TaxID=3452730 RepID=UPI003F78BB16
MKILIAIPNYNNAHYICETLDSVINQEIKDASIDIVVFDNKSTDHSVDKIRQAYGNLVKVIVNQSNVGAVQNHNLCLDYAEKNGYDFLKLLSSDDVLFPNIINTQYQILKNIKRASLISCGMILTDEYLNPLSEYSFFPSNKTQERFVKVDGNVAIKKCASRGVNYIGNPSSFLIRVSLINGVRFNTSFRWVSDLLFASELLVNRTFLYVPHAGFYYRRHNDTDSHNIRKISGLQFREHQLYCNLFNGGVIGYLANVKHYLKSRWTSF